MPGSQGREGGLQNAAGSFLGQDVVLGPVSPGGIDGFTNSPGGYDMSSAKRKDFISQRKQREFIPDNKKDDSYWDRRRRNNEAAKRSREKRRFNDMVLEQRVVELTKENHVLKAQLEAIKEEYGICGENIVCVEKVMATLPTNEQVLSLTKRPKLTGAGPSAMLYQNSPSPIPTPVIHQPVSHPVMGSPPPPPVTNNALNLSSRSRKRSRSRSGSRVQSPFEVSSGSGSGDEGCVRVSVSVSTGSETSAVNTVTAVSAAATAAVPDPNNSLPLKLRHKSHLGDKDAASALLSLQNIKQEPGPRASPPWDGEGSSDERDSGISLGAEWSSGSAMIVADETNTENKHRLHSEIVRLSTEVANLKSLVIRNKGAVKSLPLQH
ncbi:vrille [Carabus blaptoides fortunei]